MKTATVILDRQDQGKIEGKVSRIVENYESFALVEATDDQIDALKRDRFKVVVKQEPSTIKLGAFTINTDKPRFSANNAVLPHTAYTHATDPGPDEHHYIVQFVGPIKEEWKAEVERLGGKIGDPLPSHSYIVELDGDARVKVINLPYVRWVGHYDPSYRLAPGLIQEAEAAQQSISEGIRGPEAMLEERPPSFASRAPPVPNVFLVSFQSLEVMDEARSKIEALGAKIVDQSERTATVSFPQDTPDIADKLRQMAAIHGVLAIEALRIKQLRNNIAARIMAGLPLDAALNMPLDGTGEMIAVADTGLDTGDPETIHEDFKGRVTGIISWPISQSFSDRINNPGADDGPADLGSGHGTHVTGSVIGNGSKSQNLGPMAVRGLAPKAHLFFQAIEQRMAWKIDFYRRKYGLYVLSGLPDDLTQIFLQAYDAGARIHTNSWGGGDFGAYDFESKDVDRFVWDHKDMIILFAAGNDGRDWDRDGKIDQGSITPPATAKNCISVGASENVRQNIKDTYKEIGPLEFPSDPIASDLVADNPDDIAAFSSRGPCMDNRFKPDVVAPGTSILSTKSSEISEMEGTEYDDFYMYLSGTSMATPLTAGAAALIRQYLRKETQGNPSAALVKAALIHTAIRKPYRYAASDPDTAMWDPEQGWGHANLKPFIADTPGWSMKFMDVSSGLQTGRSWTESFNVTSSDKPVKVTLVWTDYPGQPDKYPNLVNNLDLMITAPDGKDYHGNVFSSPYDERFDDLNNVESVLIAEPKLGEYKITVIATEVREGPQDFALVFSGGL